MDGKALYLAFSVIFSDGEYAGSTLEIQGADKFSMPQREFGIVSGTGYFRFVKGYGILETHFLDVANLKAILKLTVRVKHYWPILSFYKSNDHDWLSLILLGEGLSCGVPWHCTESPDRIAE